MFFVYVIKNESSGKLYIGHTKDLEKRLERHNSKLPNKRSSYTNKNKGFWMYVHKEKFNSRGEAKKRERELKTAKGREFVKKLITRP